MPTTILPKLLFLAAACGHPHVVKDLAPATPGEPRTEARLALVIGNQAYPAAPLRSPVADATAVAGALREAGFEVRVLADADRHAMMEAVSDFAHARAPGDRGLLYYSGHGVQVDGRDWLIPVDATIERPEDVGVWGLAVDRLLADLASAQGGRGVVILDAAFCDPFVAGRHCGPASAQVPPGTLVAWASCGEPAQEESGFTRALVPRLAEPGAEILQVLERVGLEVESATGGTQTPCFVSALQAPFLLSPPADTLAERFRMLIPQDLPVQDSPPDPPAAFAGAPEAGAFGVRIEVELSRAGAPFLPVPLTAPICDGDFVAFRFTPSAAGQVAVLNHGTSGAWRLVWPAREGEEPGFGPDRPVRLPTDAHAGFPVSGPPGDEYVLLLFSPGPFSPGLRQVRDRLRGGEEAAPVPGMRFLVPSDPSASAAFAVGPGEQAVAFALDHRAACGPLPAP